MSQRNSSTIISLVQQIFIGSTLCVRNCPGTRHRPGKEFAVPMKHTFQCGEAKNKGNDQMNKQDNWKECKVLHSKLNKDVKESNLEWRLQ